MHHIVVLVILAILISHPVYSIEKKKSLTLSSLDKSSVEWVQNRSSSIRAVVEHFISIDRVAMIVELLQQGDPYMIELRQGLHMNGVYSLLVQTMEFEERKSNRKMTLQMSHNLKLYINMLEVIEMMILYTEAYFNVDLMIETASVNTLQLPFQQSIVRFGQFDTSLWSYGMHADQCGLTLGKDSVTCVETSTKAREFTAILYLNESVGGDFVFIDIPRLGGHEQTLSGVSAGTRQRRNTQVDDLLITREGMATHVSPSAGKLLVFSAGVENVHAVSALLSDHKRRTLSLWLTRVPPSQTIKNISY